MPDQPTDAGPTQPGSAPWTIRNRQATAGLVLGIAAFAGLLWSPLVVVALAGLVLSGLGLNRAGALQGVGYAPVGRTQARWGLALSVVAAVATLLS